MSIFTFYFFKHVTGNANENHHCILGGGGGKLSDFDNYSKFDVPKL